MPIRLQDLFRVNLNCHWPIVVLRTDLPLSSVSSADCYCRRNSFVCKVIASRNTHSNVFCTKQFVLIGRCACTMDSGCYGHLWTMREQSDIGTVNVLINTGLICPLMRCARATRFAFQTIIPHNLCVISDHI